MTSTTGMTPVPVHDCPTCLQPAVPLTAFWRVPNEPDKPDGRIVVLLAAHQPHQAPAVDRAPVRLDPITRALDNTRRVCRPRRFATTTLTVPAPPWARYNHTPPQPGPHNLAPTIGGSNHPGERPGPATREQDPTHARPC